jgi:tetratricopeptide (TPR) repeat protein
MAETRAKKEKAETSEEKTEKSTLEALDDDLAFLSDESNNMNFYLASRAFHEERDYEKAIEKYQAAIEYEKSRSSDASEDEDADNGDMSPDDVLAKATYWLGEAYVKAKQIDKAIETFKELTNNFEKHYLKVAAERRLAALKAKYPSSKGETV